MNALARSAKASTAVKVALAVSLAGIANVGCASSPIVAQSTQLCKDWRVLSRSKQDQLTKRTADEMLANNKAREVWGCDPRANRAKAG